MYKNIFFIYSIIIIQFFSSCEERKIYTPKPKGYFRIDFPQREYIKYDSICPFEFEYSKYSKIITDKSKNEPCWFDISYPTYNVKIHISYKPIEDNIETLFDDTRTLVYKHTQKADAIDEMLFVDSENDVYGLMYDISGNAASLLQFYLTDSTEHFLRGALYFYNVPNKDSLTPVFNYVRQDVVNLIESFKWKN
jgi:gliding motility-associated lipoprotein GldD